MMSGRPDTPVEENRVVVPLTIGGLPAAVFSDGFPSIDLAQDRASNN